jgi:glycosyltransferase involved in cell wall biosynthesis
MEFSVIIPLYNKLHSVEKTLQSVLAQTWHDFEVIVVDDGSTDGGPDIVKQYRDGRIRLISQLNAGVSAARNNGIRQAKSGLIAFLDADDLWEPGYLEEMAGLIRKFPEAGMYGCAFDKVSGNSSFKDDFHLPEGYKGLIDNYFRQAIGYHLYSSSSVIIRKSATEKSGFFDERIGIGEDKDYWFRIALDHKVAFCNKVLAHYNLDAENRAMGKKHPFTKSILYYTSKYAEMEKLNPEFRFFINRFRIVGIPELLLKYDTGKKQVNDYLSQIDPAGQSLKFRIFLKLPIFLKKMISIMYLKYRGLEA